jgi:hypothetical protein
MFKTMGTLTRARVFRTVRRLNDPHALALRAPRPTRRRSGRSEWAPSAGSRPF